VKHMRWILAALLLASGAGCILVSGQIFTTFSLNDIHVTGATGVDGENIDLNTNKDYTDNKDKMKSLADFAFIGEFTNVTSNPLNVEVWITPDVSNYTDASEVRAHGTQLWGPFSLAGSSTKKLTWDESAAVLNAAGKAVLISEIRGDGQFSLYALGASGDYEFRVTHGALLLTLDVGK
jgi:hypothetical protein